jgi:hypothetical protein
VVLRLVVYHDDRWLGAFDLTECNLPQLREMMIWCTMHFGPPGQDPETARWCMEKFGCPEPNGLRWDLARDSLHIVFYGIQDASEFEARWGGAFPFT